jgi:glycosyltransferase involved in cell wall biosynthesis
MVIGVNLLYLIPGKVGGTETYARELLPILSQTEKLVVFCDRSAAKTFNENENTQIIPLPFNSSNRLARIILEQSLLPILCLIHKVDVLFSLGYSAPLIHHCPSVVTIHDLNWYYHPEDFSSLNRFMWQWLTRLSAKFSTHIITDSQASAASLHSVLKLPKDKISPILHATPTKVKAKKYPIQKPYLFTVMANYPHKNLTTLLQSFAMLSKKFPNLNLVVCGLGAQSSSTDRIKYLGYVTKEELAYLYANAEVFVFPSAYEGFGYPVLEAMSYGAPVISSNAYSLSEVVLNGGILVDPFDVEAYATAITDLVGSQRYRQKLITRGEKRASELKWKHTADKTIKILRKTALL